MSRVAAIAAFGALLLAQAAPCRAGDHTNLEEGLPVGITDAKPIGYLGREVQALLRYDHAADHDEDFLSELRLEAGFPRNGQLSLALPYRFGEIEPDGFQAVRAELLYNLNQETLVLPSLSLAAELDLPVGNDAHGVDTTAKAILTKTVPFTELFQQVHLNFEWTVNDDVRPGERSRGWRGAAGYSVRLGPQTLGILDAVHEARLERGERETLAELGLRHQLTPLTVLSFGVGAGLTSESPGIRATLAAQYAF
jgi:hypothetical protein